MPQNPYPMLEKVCRVYTPKEMIGVDLDDPEVWDHPDVTDYRFMPVHWGGGSNSAGWPIEEPTMTMLQKLAVQLGRIKSVLKGWLAYHLTKFSTIAYSSWVDSLFGRIGRLRGHRWNAGQWGSINQITHAVVLVMGFGQVASMRAWQAIGLLWFCSGAPQVVGHRFFNSWSQTQTKTFCPGDENDKAISEERYITALGVLRYRKGNSSHGRCVRACSEKLRQIGYLDQMYSRYNPKVRRAVVAFQVEHGLTPDGLCGKATWKKLAAA